MINDDIKKAIENLEELKNMRKILHDVGIIAFDDKRITALDNAIAWKDRQVLITARRQMQTNPISEDAQRAIETLELYRPDCTCAGCQKTANKFNLAITALQQTKDYNGTCNNCGGQIMTGYMFCPYCGEFPEGIEKEPCETCKNNPLIRAEAYYHELDDGEKIEVKCCPNCGRKLEVKL